MKKILLFAVALATASYCFAQNDSLRIKLDNIFENLDKSVVPTGMLKEYGYEFANFETYNGQLTDSNIISNNSLRLAYASLLSSTIYGSTTLPLMEAFNTTQKSKFGNNINPVNVLLINYASLKPNAVDDGMFTIANEQLYNGNGVNPYLTQTLFAAAPVFSESRDGKVTLLFSTDLFYTNTGTTITTIDVDFNNGGGFVNALPDLPLHAQYADTGTKRITIKISFTNGTTMQCYSQLRVTRVAATFANRYAPQAVPNILIPSSTEHSGGQIFVQYSVNNTTPANNRKLLKPFIVVEGFDMHDAAPGIQPDGYTYLNFHSIISDFTSTNFNNASLNDNLDNVAGYDLIFLNYNDGTDDILRNAKLLEEVINWVNNNKAPGADANVVMGISMGGLVSRYCLASMTKRSLNPQTRLLITHDSPHRGANIPLAYQHAIFGLQNFVIKVGPLEMRLGSIISQLDEFEVLRNRPATQQQILALANHGGSVTMNTFLNGTYRDMVTFPNATPPPYKFIATSQGSQCGTPVFAPYTSLVSGSGFGGYDVLFGLSGRKYVFNLQLNALPEYGQVKEITHLTLKGRKKIFFINTPYLTLLSIKRNSPPNMYPIDGVAGSIQDFERSGLPSVIPQSYGGFTAIWLADLFYFFSGLNFQPSFTFISTTSALDGANSSTFNLPYIFAANGQNGSHAETYIAQEPRIASGVTLYNIAHTDFTARNSEWIFNEMENRHNTTGCEQLDCNAPAIAPLTTICPGNKTYHIANNNSTQPVTWSIEPQGIVTVVSQGNAIQVIRGEATNDVTLTAQFINGCGQQQSSSFKTTDVRPIYGLLGTPGISINDASAWCPGTTRTFTMPVYAPGLTYNWQVGSGSLSIVSALPHTNAVTVLYSGGTRGAETVSVSGYSTCDRLRLYEYAAGNFADVITGTVTSANGYNSPLNTINRVGDNNALVTVDVATGNQLTYTLTGGLPQAWGAYVDEPNTMFIYNQNGGDFDFNVSYGNSNCNTTTDMPFTIRLVSQPGSYNPAFVISPNPVVNSTIVALNARAATTRYVTQCLQAGGYVSVKVMSSATGTQILPTINGLPGTSSVRVNMSSLPTGQVYLFVINATGCPNGVYQEVQQVLH